MKRNMGPADRGIRVVLAGVGWWLAATIGYATAGGVIVLVVAGILAATAAVGYCPLYAPLSLSTRGGVHRIAQT